MFDIDLIEMDIHKIQRENDIGIIILAAGASSRLGQPKQFLKFGNTTLLQHTISVAKSVGFHPVIIVSGKDHDLIINSLNINDLIIVHNNFWYNGMTSSIVCGLKGLLRVAPEVKAAIIMVCDQPFISSSLIAKMKDRYIASGKKIIQCQYKEGKGPPVLFDKSLFEQIITLDDPNGARSLIAKFQDDLELISFPEGCIDIDTIEDYNSLKNMENNEFSEKPVK